MSLRIKSCCREDYETLKRIYKEDNTEEAISLPKANVIRILLEEGFIALRPSVQNLNSNSTYHLTSITSNKSHKTYTIIYLVIANSVTKTIYMQVSSIKYHSTSIVHFQN